MSSNLQIRNKEINQHQKKLFGKEVDVEVNL